MLNVPVFATLIAIARNSGLRQSPHHSMNNNRGSLFLILALAGCLAALYWQHQQTQSFRSEADKLRAALSEAERDATNKRLNLENAEKEIERMRNGEHELLKLRGETSVLRRQVGELQASAKTSDARAQEGKTQTTPLKTFSSLSTVMVLNGHSFITGGWATGQGKKTFAVISPTMVDGAGNRVSAGKSDQVVVQGRLIQVPEALAKELHLDRLLQNKESLSEEQALALLKQLEQTPGVEVLSAPRVLTLSGRQAQIAVLNDSPVGPTGPSIDLIPSVQEDSSIQMTVFAQFAAPRE